MDQLTCYKKDIEKSKALLKEAGVADLKFTVIAAVDEPPTAVAEAQNIQAQLTEIGVMIDIETLELGVYVDRWLKGDFDAAIALNGGNPDPDNMFFRYWHSTGNLQAVSNYSSPELDKLLEEGRSTTDVAKRKEIYTEVQKQLTDAAPWIWLYVGYEYRAMQPTVQGFTPMSNGSTLYLRETWLGIRVRCGWWIVDGHPILSTSHHPLSNELFSIRRMEILHIISTLPISPIPLHLHATLHSATPAGTHSYPPGHFDNCLSGHAPDPW